MKMPQGDPICKDFQNKMWRSHLFLLGEDMGAPKQPIAVMAAFSQDLQSG